MSILHANPSLRDTRNYLASFGPRPQKTSSSPTPSPGVKTQPAVLPASDVQDHKQNALVKSILEPVSRHTALVKVQGPFTQVQLDSIAKGLVYLEKLGLVSVLVVENDLVGRGDEGERMAMIEETTRVVSALEKQGVRARPFLGATVRLGPKPGEEDANTFTRPEAHTIPGDLAPIESALRSGEIPVISPFALDSFCRSVRIDANDVIGALACGMTDHAKMVANDPAGAEDVDLTPLRLMIINREGGVPSYARYGFPHLLINLNSEYDYIQDTFLDAWRESNPTALSNLSLARTCLSYMPPTSSAIMVSHRSQSSLIGNLITNKPAVSSSLPHALLQGNRRLTHHTPTLLRRGLPIRVVTSLSELDRAKTTALLEQSFKRKLNKESFYSRLERSLDFVVVAGDYEGAAIVTNESTSDPSSTISYLDKFAVLPSHQGDGTVDFLWVALHDETYGLGHPFSVNPNGGKQGQGEGRDLVWRSRADNPVNKWYYERSSGHLRLGSWVLFWCDTERRLRVEGSQRGGAGLSYVEDWERGRLSTWADSVQRIPSSWM